MKRFVTACLLLAILFACNSNKTEQHAHNPAGSHPGEEGLTSLSYTLYSAKSELFVEFKPLVVGQVSKFAAHLTILGEYFLPYMEGKVTVSLLQSGSGIRQTSDAPSSPGIFRLALQPSTPGYGKLVFDIKTRNFTDQFIFDSVKIYPDEKTAIAAQPAKVGGNDISFSKEQAWKTEFANAPVKRETIYDIVKATGEIQAAPGDEVTIAAKSNGIIKYAGSNNITGYPVRAGQAMFSVTGGEIAFENIEAAKEAARAELATAKSEYERAAELIKDKLVTKGEYETAKLRYEQARIALNSLGRNYSGGKSLSSPINGFIKSILVSEGQYVNAGQPLAIVTKNQRIVLKADVSLKDAGKINSIREANFTIAQTRQIYSTKELNAKLVAVGKTAAGTAPFIPIQFQMGGRPDLLPGTFTEVFLKTSPIENALVIPVSALLEEQGIFYAYVQTEGESFQKRELKLGANDGLQVQVLSGVKEGERVVTKGAYQIKLSQASGALPVHGHEH